MKKIRISDLISIVQRILQGAGVNAEESLLVARSLVSSNIMGHDSHGVVRVAQYVPWIKEGSIQLGKELTLVKEADASALMLLIKSGVDPAAMIKMFQVLSKHSSPFPEAISTHPEMSSRLERLETLIKQDPEFKSRNVLKETSWESLQNICQS